MELLYIKNGLIRHNIHARYDITENHFCTILTDMINKKHVQLISFMDHTPGQGQYRNIEEMTEFIKKYRSLNSEAARQLVEQRLEYMRQKGVTINVIRGVSNSGNMRAIEAIMENMVI